MSELFTTMLNEPVNTLGRTEEAVEIILADRSRIEELYECYFQSDEWVRLRTSSVFKRLWKADPSLVVPFLDGFVKEVSLIKQPSVQWTFALLCHDLDAYLTKTQRRTCKARLKGYLGSSDDWIVQNTTIATLGQWALNDEALRTWLVPKLTSLTNSHRKSVVKRSRRWLKDLG